MSVPHPKLAQWIQEQLDRNDWSVTDLATQAGIDRSGVQRWKAGTLRPNIDNARILARACRRPILEVLVASDYLTPDEIGQETTSQPDPTRLTARQLTTEMLRRLEASEVGDRARLTREETDAEPERYVEINVNETPERAASSLSDGGT